MYLFQIARNVLVSSFDIQYLNIYIVYLVCIHMTASQYKGKYLCGAS